MLPNDAAVIRFACALLMERDDACFQRRHMPLETRATLSNTDHGTLPAVAA